MGDNLWIGGSNIPEHEVTTPGRVATRPTLSPEQQTLLNQLIGQVGPQIGEGVDIDPSALQTQGFDAIQQMLAGGAPGAGEAQTALSRILGAGPTGTRGATVAGPTGTGTAGMLGPTAGGFDPESAKDYWQKSFVDPSMDLWGDIKGKTMEPFAAMGGMRSGEAMRAMGRAGKEFTTGLTGQLSDILYKGKEAGAGREFTGQESYAGRMGGASEAAMGREFGAGESWASRLLGASEGQVGREFAAGESDISRMLQIPGMSQQMTQTEMMPIQQAMQAGQTQFDIGQMGEAWNNPWLQLLAPALETQTQENLVLPPSTQRGGWGQFWGK